MWACSRNPCAGDFAINGLDFKDDEPIGDGVPGSHCSQQSFVREQRLPRVILGPKTLNWGHRK